MLQWPDITDTNKYYIFDSQSGEIVRKLETGKDTLLLMGGWSPDGQWSRRVITKARSTSGRRAPESCSGLSPACPGGTSSSGLRMVVRSPCYAIDYDNGINAIQVLDAGTYQLLLTIEGDLMTDQYQWFRWSPDSTRIAISGGSDEMGQVTNPIYIYDASSGEELLKYLGTPARFMGVSWSPDGKRIVSGSTDDTTRIWDAQTGAELLTLPTPGDWYVIPDWSPDGQVSACIHKIYSAPGVPACGASGRPPRSWSTTPRSAACSAS
jgi:WD40 repeat protein